MSGPLGVAIVGCGLIGRKRAAALPGGRLVACADLSHERARALASATPGAVAIERWQDALARPDVDIVIVATTNDVLAEIALNYLIGEEMQTALSANGNNTGILSVAKKAAAADPAWAAIYPSNEKDIANVQYYPYDAYFKDWDNIVATWDREILRKKAG